MAVCLKLTNYYCSLNKLNLRIIKTTLSNCSRYFANAGDAHFGFESVSEDEKEKRVYEVFHKVAEKYDVMNDAMSLGIHRLWKDYFMEKLCPVPGTKLIDVAGGTGDIAFRFLKYVKNEVKTSKDDERNDLEIPDNLYNSSENGPPKTVPRSSVMICDINQAMLEVGKKRKEALEATPGDITWLLANAESMPVADNTYDAYTVAFGIRNMTHFDKVLSEAFRILKVGGKFMCLEFSDVKNPIIKRLYDQYSFTVIPVLGQLITYDWKSYQYLVESIRQFPPQEEFADMIREAGFSSVTYENLTGGVAAIHCGFKLA